MDQALELRPTSFYTLETCPQFAALLDEYALECGIEGLPPPKIKIETYKKLESLGSLGLVGAYLDKTMVGFIVVLVHELPHYSANIAMSESFFVAKEHRKTGAGLKLLKEAEQIATKLNCCGLLVSAPFNGRLFEILPKIGYVETNRVFFRNLAP